MELEELAEPHWLGVGLTAEAEDGYALEDRDAIEAVDPEGPVWIDAYEL